MKIEFETVKRSRRAAASFPAPGRRGRAGRSHLSIGKLTVLTVIAGLLVMATGIPPAIDPDGAAASPGERLERAEAEASALRSELASSREAMLAAEGRAADAATRQDEVATLLGEGRERRIALEIAVESADRRLESETSRLARAEVALGQRLVEIYKAGPADAITTALEADGYEDLVTRAAYMRQIHEADLQLARRVEEVRGRVAEAAALLRGHRSEALELERALEAAHADRVLVAEEAERTAGQLRLTSDERDQALSTLTARISEWERQIETAQRRQREEVRSSDPVAESESTDEPSSSETVEGWFGGPYSIPTTIVMCESGGNYRALNPTSGAGGAYQIIPSTWEAYGGTGLPHEASKAEQDRIASLIWANDGPGAWVCKE